MKRFSHIIWTFSISLWIYDLYFNLNLFENIFYSSITAFLSFLPDIDLKIVRYFHNLNFKTLFISYPLYLLIKIIFKHRTITHSVFFSLIFLVLYYFLNSNHYLGLLIFTFFLAIILHIFEDSLTIAGVQPLFPIKFKFRLFFFRTSSSFDEFIINILGLLILIMYSFGTK